MRWRNRAGSDKVEDRRRLPSGKVAAGGTGAVLLAIASWYFGADPRALLNFFKKPAGPEAKQVAPAQPGAGDVAGEANPGGADSDAVNPAGGDPGDPGSRQTSTGDGATEGVNSEGGVGAPTADQLVSSESGAAPDGAMPADGGTPVDGARAADSEGGTDAAAGADGSPKDVAADNSTPARAATVDPDLELKQFVSVVLRDTEDIWSELFKSQGHKYRKPTLVLFNDPIPSACGLTDSAAGPFYCPADERVYLDLSFFRELSERFEAPGDFAQAYVVAHEVGHHVQKQLGITDHVHELKRKVSKVEANKLSVRLELQADFFAGVWAHHADAKWRILEPGDIEEAMQCAAAIGDDRLQRLAKGQVVPDSFTHGTSEQRAYWFRLGLETGDVHLGDTFNRDIDGRDVPLRGTQPRPNSGRSAPSPQRAVGPSTGATVKSP
ncbi:MAG TPA: neutral zinc metallopeptidase, partial [Pirellulaceae bacterium]|nr:neutral zinc metallopeptidase [Pirellulaceae bacterium]